MPRVLLTFDDGPGPSTEALLDVLAAAATRATFFVLGANLEVRRATAIRAVREGHELGNHTFTHARPTAIELPQLAAELNKVDAMIRAIYLEAGVAAPATIQVRLPYGIAEHDPRVPWLASLGRVHAGWTADFADWEPCDARILATRMATHIATQHARGLDAVLDLHDSSRLGAERTATVQAVRLLLA